MAKTHVVFKHKHSGCHNPHHCRNGGGVGANVTGNQQTWQEMWCEEDTFLIDTCFGMFVKAINLIWDIRVERKTLWLYYSCPAGEKHGKPHVRTAHRFLPGCVCKAHIEMRRPHLSLQDYRLHINILPVSEMENMLPPSSDYLSGVSLSWL